MNRQLPALLGAMLFSFFGLFDQTQEYGDLTGALKRTMAQSLPPYHETADISDAQRGVAPERKDPGRANPPAAIERTPSAP